jgi:hypothetical protein
MVAHNCDRHFEDLRKACVSSYVVDGSDRLKLLDSSGLELGGVADVVELAALRRTHQYRFWSHPVRMLSCLYLLGRSAYLVGVSAQSVIHGNIVI